MPPIPSAGLVVIVRQPGEVEAAGSDDDGSGGDDACLRAGTLQVIGQVLNEFALFAVKNFHLPLFGLVISDH